MGEKIKVDDRGRVTIPTNLREKYGIGPGDELNVEDSQGKILLNPIRKSTKKLKFGKKWDKKAFFKTGEVTFEE